MYAIYSLNDLKEKIVTYCISEEIAKKLIPKEANDRFRIVKVEDNSELLNTDIPIISEVKGINIDLLRSSVVVKPMRHRTNLLTYYQTSVYNYIKTYLKKPENNTKLQSILFDLEDFKEKSFDLNIINREIDRSWKKYDTTYHLTRVRKKTKEIAEVLQTVYADDIKKAAQAKLREETLKKECKKENKKNKDIIRLPDFANFNFEREEREKYKYKPYVKHEEDGVNVFKWSYNFCMPDMEPDVSRLFLPDEQQESKKVNLVYFGCRPDRNFTLVCYTTTREKADEIVYNKLNKLIKTGFKNVNI